MQELEDSMAAGICPPSWQLPEYVTSVDNPLTHAYNDLAEEEDEQAAADPTAAAERAEAAAARVEASQQARGLRDHLECGSCAPKEGTCASEGTIKSLKAAMMEAEVDKAKQEQERCEELERQLIKEYPHGIPKRVLRELRAQGVSLPTLGFGFTCNVRPQTACLLRG